MQQLTITVCQGTQITPHLPALARLRIEVFRDFPYLYDGELSYEEDYLGRYAENPASLFVLALDGDHLVGAATGQPLADEVDEFRSPFEANSIQPEQVFYYGESLLLHGYRGHGIGKRFIAEREAHARQQGFELAAFCAVERPDGHPSEPHNYRPLHDFWNTQGYQRHDKLATTFAWKDVGEHEESHKTMVFWLKPLT
ncbi:MULTISPECIES: GNAT family N-acetyltransferase [unclassified Halomonas]|uniref:GNAT family N-acetyltransferase n=1 Tax=unclassified Halomonas TaxID=2609666 RepID=UPI0009905A3D|nr:MULTISPECIES: GNAT family N-acetyltransferase [unclassified Halomonas]AQU82209.1 GNAT family N-acetyltransferase [Halomonas sp. 'Soap Lake \